MADLANISIGRLTVRGRTLSAAQGRAVALWAAQALASRHAAGGSLDKATLRLPAAALRPDGSVDPAKAGHVDGGHG